MTAEEYLKLKSMHDKHWYFLGKKDIINHLIKKHKQNPKILDIGCGDGYFFDKYDGIGIEPYEIFKGKNIINEPLESVRITDKFDIIIALDVLEHLKDDTLIQKFIDENLTEGGMAIITVPAHRHLYNQHDEMHHHYRRYDKNDLKEVLEKYNPYITYYNSILYPIAYIIRKLSNGKDNLKLPSKFINSILYSIFSFEKYTYKLHFNGMSLLAILKK